MITLHQYEISPYCNKVRRILHLKRQPYRIREVPVSRSFSVKRINPVGKLPCLEHDGHYVSDSTDIAHYLEEKFPDPPLLPKDPELRGFCHILEDWADESLYFYEMFLRFTLPHNSRRWVPELAKSDVPLMRKLAPTLVPRMLGSVLKKQGLGRKSLESVLKDIERHVAAVSDILGDGHWLVGDSLTLADIAVFVMFECLRGTPEGSKIIMSHPGVTAWMERVDRASAAP
jgi:glutathione S-transferase